MLIMITLVGLCIFVFSVGYMAGRQELHPLLRLSFFSFPARCWEWLSQTACSLLSPSLAGNYRRHHASGRVSEAVKAARRGRSDQPTCDRSWPQFRGSIVERILISRLADIRRRGFCELMSTGPTEACLYRCWHTAFRTAFLELVIAHRPSPSPLLTAPPPISVNRTVRHQRDSPEPGCGRPVRESWWRSARSAEAKTGPSRSSGFNRDGTRSLVQVTAVPDNRGTLIRNVLHRRRPGFGVRKTEIRTPAHTAATSFHRRSSLVAMTGTDGCTVLSGRYPGYRSEMDVDGDGIACQGSG